MKYPFIKCQFSLIDIIGGSTGGGGVTGVAPPPPFKISKIKKSNRTIQKIGDNPLEKVA